MQTGKGMITLPVPFWLYITLLNYARLIASLVLVNPFPFNKERIFFLVTLNKSNKKYFEAQIFLNKIKINIQ
jgi:hypothetical protein